MIVRHYKHFETSLMSNHRLQWTLAHTLSFSTVRVYKMALPRVFVCHRSGTPFCTLSWGSLVHWKQTELIQPALFQRPLPHGLLIPNTLYTLFIHIYIYEKATENVWRTSPQRQNPHFLWGFWWGVLGKLSRMKKNGSCMKRGSQCQFGMIWMCTKWLVQSLDAISVQNGDGWFDVNVYKMGLRRVFQMRWTKLVAPIILKPALYKLSMTSIRKKTS